MKKSLFIVIGLAVSVLLLLVSHVPIWMKNYTVQVTPDNFFKTEEEFISALGAAYTQFGDWAADDPQTITGNDHRRNDCSYKGSGLG